MQLQHVDVPDRDFAVERIASASVEQAHLTGMIEPGKIEHVLDVSLLGAVEYRRRNRHAVTKIAAELHETLLVERLDGLILAVNFAQQFLERLGISLAVIEIDGIADLDTEAGTSPAEMRLQDLTDIHTARHAEWIENDVPRRPIGEERRVLERH